MNEFKQNLIVPQDSNKNIKKEKKTYYIMYDKEIKLEKLMQIMKSYKITG